MRDFRFGVNFLSPDSADEWVDFCRQVEGQGYDVVHAPDHLGAPAPFPMLAAAAKLVTEHLPYLTVDEALETPFLLFGTVDEMARQLRDRRERYGISYFVVHQPYADALAPVIDRLRD